MNVTTYAPNGRILGVMSIPAIDLEVATANQLWIEAWSDPLTQYVDNGQVVDMPPRPSEQHVFDFDSKQWLADTELAEARIKATRLGLLLQTDWTQIPNCPLTDDAKAQWALYRQALRDITDQPGYPLDVVWPTQPGAT